MTASSMPISSNQSGTNRIAIDINWTTLYEHTDHRTTNNANRLVSYAANQSAISASPTSVSIYTGVGVGGGAGGALVALFSFLCRQRSRAPQGDREKRRVLPAEITEEKVALNNQNAGNPNWATEFGMMDEI